jgi:glycosyltransferase involved in cell wall biosynthesis
VPALRVTFVAPFGLRRKGTTRARVLPLAAALAARGHSVRVVVPAWDSPEDWGRRDHLPGLDVLHLPIRSARRRPELSPALLAAVWRAATAGAPDVLHCFKPIGYSGAVAYGATLAARRSGRPRLVAVDADDLEGRQGWSRRDGRSRWQVALLDLQERRTIRAAPLVTVASAELRRRAIEWGCRPDRVCYLPNAVPPPAARSGCLDVQRGAPAGVLLYTRFNEFTPERAVRILDEVLTRLPGAHVTVVGDGQGRGRFERLVRSRSWAAQVSSHGFQEGAALAALLGAPNVALWLFDNSPTNRARCPSKLAELLAAGRAVVGEDVGEVRALVGSAGRLVAAGDGAAIVDAVAELIADETARTQLETAAAVRARAELSWKTRASDLESVYLRYT